MFIFGGITVELAPQDDHSLKDIFHLILELNLNNGFVEKADLLSRESSLGGWEANEILVLREIVAYFTLSIFVELGGEERQLCAWEKLYGPDLCDRLGEPIEILLVGHKNYPNMILKTIVVAEDPFGQAYGRNTNDINNTITQRQEEASLVPNHHHDEPTRLGNLGSSLEAQLQNYGAPGETDDTIARLQETVNLIPDGQPDKPRLLNSLGLSLQARFKLLGNPNDIENAISQLQAAVILTSDGHPDKPIWLNNLGISLIDRFERRSSLYDLENAINSFQAAIILTPDGHPDKPAGLINLGNTLLVQFQRTGSLGVIDDAIIQLQAAVNLTPDGHPDKPSRLNNLGASLRDRFDRLGNFNDIDNAISQLQTAVSLIPDGRPDKPACLTNLGVSLLARFNRFGGLDDIDNGIARLQAAVELTPDHHLHKPMRLSNLGASLRDRFERLGNLDDIDNAIYRFQAAVNLTPDGHLHRPKLLSNLGYSLQLRSKRLGSPNDNDNAIARLQETVNLTPDGHPDKPNRLNSLGASLQTRFERFGDPSDIDNAVKRFQAAINLTPDGHPHKPRWLNNLGSSLWRRFDRLGGTDDLNNAIEQIQASVSLTPDGHPDKPRRLSNLGTSLMSRFEHLGNFDDIDNAISRHQVAASLTPDDLPEKAIRISSFGTSLLSRFKHLHHPQDAEMSVAQFSVAALSPVGSPSHRLKAAKMWIYAASIIKHTSLLDACESAVGIIPLVAWLGLSIPDRHQHLVQMGGIVREAAAIAISLGQYDKAVEWLEQGRSIVWTQILQLRTPVDELRAVEPGLADRLLHISSLLDRNIQDTDSQIEPSRSPEEESRRYRALAKERDEIVETVRSLPKFHNFLQPLRLESLSEAAKDGPVILVNVSETRCDALGLLSGSDEVIHIPLPDLTLNGVIRLQVEFNSLLKSNGIRKRAIRDEDGEGGGDEECKKILAMLWDQLVNPVLDSLAFSPDPDTLPRIWWCVTGPLAFLPIHAAGVYDTKESNKQIQDYIIASYTPTVSALLARSDAPVHRPFRHLSAIEPSSGASYIPNTEKELACIRIRLQNREHVVLHKAQATKERVIEEMRDCNWLHLACHGTQNATNPTKSALVLHGGKLTLEEIIQLNLPHAEFAFLSACQTMTGDEGLSDEAVHIAGGMSLAGYRSVVATMWSIEDALAPKVADEFYARLLKDGERPDNRKAAEALYFSVKKLREENKDIRMLSWLPFVHLGI
ncbi:hypothetical protein FRB91_008453 [Serendipita sp. 411]|nr:hypothetical protein FRB91_008453 [Serendipita sp. 411]